METNDDLVQNWTRVVLFPCLIVILPKAQPTLTNPWRFVRQQWWKMTGQDDSRAYACRQHCDYRACLKTCSTMECVTEPDPLLVRPRRSGPAIRLAHSRIAASATEIVYEMGIPT